MDFDLSEEQRILKKTARDFLRKESPKQWPGPGHEMPGGYSPELWRKMAELGWLGLIIPEEYGGSGASFLDLIVLMEEMGYHLCASPFLSTVVLAGVPVTVAGDQLQKGEILPKIASGQMILTLALAEPGARYDAASIRVRAIRDGDAYAISGTKLFVPDAHVAHWILCVARTKECEDPADGITIFLVDGGTPGVKTTPLKTIARDRQCEVIFDNVRVSEEKILGVPHHGWPVARETLEKAAVALCAEMIGGAQAVTDMALQYAKERIQFDRPIGSFQAIQHHFANMWMAINGSRHLLYKAAWRIAKGMPAAMEVAMAKARVGDVYRQVTTVGHQVFGAIGFTSEHGMHLYHRRALAGSMAFGDSDFHREVVAKSLGL